MAKSASGAGVLPGVISVPATPSKASAYNAKPIWDAMPASQINPIIAVPAKGGKK